MSNGNYRNALIRKIHVARRDLGLDDDSPTYRAFLERTTGKDSLRAMSVSELAKVVEAFCAKGWNATPRRSKDTHGLPKNFAPNPNRKGTAKLMTKIEALLAEMGTGQNGFIPWSYAASILKRMYKVERLEWATQRQLRGVIAALASGGGKRKGGQIALDSKGRAYKRTWKGPRKGWVWVPMEGKTA